MKRIVVSGGYGAGWSSWAGEKAQQIAEYEPVAEYVASGKPLLSGKERRYVGTDDWESTPWEEREDWLHPDFQKVVKQMMDDLDLDYFYTGGAEGLRVESVSGPYRIDEYDGAEAITFAEDLWSI